MPPPDIGGLTITAPDGTQFFVFGKNRIKISEHFPSNGKQVNELVEELIRAKIKENVRKIS